MTNQNNEFGKSPVKLSSPTQIWIDDVNQNNELDDILDVLYMQGEDAGKLNYGSAVHQITAVNGAKQAIQALYAPLKKQQNVNTSTEHVKPVNMSLRQAIQDLEFYTKDGEAIDFIHPEHLDKIMELVNKYNETVDVTKPKVNLIDIASPNMTPEADKVVSDAIERSAEAMNKTAKPVENGELRVKLVVYMSFYVEARDQKDPIEMSRWIDKIEELFSENISSLASAIKALELPNYDDTDLYQQGYMWAIGQAITVIQSERAKLKEVK